MQQPIKYLIKDLKPFMNNQFTINVIVIAQESKFTTKDNQLVSHYKVADKTASISLVIFGEKGAFVKPGDILNIKGAYTDVHKGRLCLYYNKSHGDVVKVGEFCMVANLEIDMSENKEKEYAPLVEKNRLEKEAMKANRGQQQRSR